MSSESSYFQLAGAHGIIMLTAWMFLASVGLITSRFYKPAWPKRTFLSVKIWFTIHRVCMVLTLLLDAAAFILIFIEGGGYVGAPGQPGYQRAHPAIGIVVTFLVILNPVLALLRCDPNDARRPLFNWTHTYIGYIAYILALINIFFGFGLYNAQNSNLPLATVSWIMFSFVMFHIFSEAVLQTHRQLRRWQHERRAKLGELSRRVVQTVAPDDVIQQKIIEQHVGHGSNKVESYEEQLPGNSTDLTPAEVVEEVVDVFSRWDYNFLYAYFFVYTAITFCLWLAMVVIMSLNI